MKAVVPELNNGNKAIASYVELKKRQRLVF
jgi:hypothetical protein